MLLCNFESAYALWEGSDVDLEGRFEKAKQHLARGELAQRLKRAVELRPLVARAHYIHTGKPRYVTVDIISGSELASARLAQQSIFEVVNAAE